MNPGTLDRWNEECKFARLEFRILKRLAEGPATNNELIDAAYFDYEDGGPLGATECVYKYVRCLKQKLGDRAVIDNKMVYELTLV